MIDHGRRHAEIAGTIAFPKYSMHWWSTRYLARLARRYVTGGRLLEVGCGTGYLLAELGRYFETYGMDMSPFALSQARRNCPQANLLFLRAEDLHVFPAGFFDILISKHVLEHIDKPAPVLDECARLLRPGGAFIYIVPNVGGIGHRWKGSGWHGVREVTHISLLHPQEWLRLTTDSGLRVLKAFGDGFWDVPYVPRVPNLLQKLVFGAPGGLQSLLGLSFLPIPLGEALVVLARKPQPIGAA